MKAFPCIAAIAGLMMMLGSGAAQAVTVAPGAAEEIDLTGPDDDDTGIILKNLSGAAGTVEISYIPGDPLGGGGGGGGATVVAPFLLLDGTLRITTSGMSSYRVCVKREYSRPRRSRGGQLLREESLRPLRRKASEARFYRATDLIRNRRARVELDRRNCPAPSREDMRRARSNAVLGYYGRDLTNNYVWAVLDIDGDLAVGGLVVPEPLSIMGLLAGAGSLLWARRRRRA